MAVCARDKIERFEANIDFTIEENVLDFPQTWTHSIGSGHAYLALRDDWRTHLQMVHDELGIEFVRFHGVLDDETFQLTRDEITNELVYNFTLVDSVYDYIISLGMKPFVELSFMPTVLASGTATWMDYHANVTPPKNITEWHMVIETFVRHLSERYGEEVASWYFEVWNEPNAESRLDCKLPLPPQYCMGTGFWAGDQSQYFELYETSANAIKGVNEQFRVGGPASAGGGWVDDFLAFVMDNNIPVDFISTHHYPSLENADSITKDVNNDVTAIREAGSDLPYILSEFNTGLEGPIPGIKALVDNDDSEYASSFFIRTIGRTVTKGAEMLSYWTFSDVFDEIRLSTVPFHDGYGLISMDNIRKPVYRAFNLLSSAGGWLLPVTSSVDSTHPCDVFATSTLQAPSSDGEEIVFNLYVSNSQPIPNVTTVLEAPICSGLLSIQVDPTQNFKLLSTSITRIDKSHANAYRMWKHEMGSPDPLSEEQTSDLHEASELVTEASDAFKINPTTGLIKGNIQVPPFGVALIQLTVS